VRRLAQYAQTTMPDNKVSWTALGFTVKEPPSKPQKLTVVQNFRLFFGSNLAGGIIKLKWEKPLDTKTSQVKGYIIQYNDLPVQPPMMLGGRGIINCWDVVSNTTITLVPPFVGANYFWITPFNSAGHGTSSDLVQYNAPGKIS
jgi:hypothetical protein